MKAKEREYFQKKKMDDVFSFNDMRDLNIFKCQWEAAS